MNKIKNLLKASPLAMAVAGLVIVGVVGVVSAAIVSYISNAATATVAVSSPVEMKIYEGTAADVVGAIPVEALSGSFGGSTFNFTTTAKNNANNRIGGYYVMVVESGTGTMTGEEFTKMEYTINEDYTGEDGDIIALGKYCVVDVDINGALTLTKLADVANATPAWGKQKMILFYDYDAKPSFDDPTGADPCSAFTINSENETRSFTHLNAAGSDTMVTRVRTFTPTWATTASGNFVISAQYVNDLAKFATEQYGL